MKLASEIVQVGKLKNFVNEKAKKFIGLDIETVENDIFLIGCYDLDNKYTYALDNFIDFLFTKLIYCCKNNSHIATWTKYDNTQILKILLDELKDETLINSVLNKINKISARYNKRLIKYTEPPLLTFKYKTFIINVENIIRDCILFRIIDKNNNSKVVWSYNIKNMYPSYTLEEVCKDANFKYYSKISSNSHIINKDKFNTDNEYKKMVILSNNLDSRIAKDLAYKLESDFFTIFQSYPNNLISAGSLARSSVISLSKLLERPINKLNINDILDLKNNDLHKKLLDYSMRAYHGGKIDSYVIGYTKKAYIIDITSAYPSALYNLKGFDDILIDYKKSIDFDVDYYDYLFIKCNLNIKNENLSTPFIIENPLNNASNLSPYGHLQNIVITKYEYEFILQNKEDIEIDIIDLIGIKCYGDYSIYRYIIDKLFNLRLQYKNQNMNTISNLLKLIINSLYGINYELTDTYNMNENEKLVNIGYRSGDFFNPIIASHITSKTRTEISNMNNIITKRGGKVLLNMTDSIMYEGANIEDLCSKEKVLGKFDYPQEITDIIILGCGRYEYKKDAKFKVKTRGFTADKKNESFYKEVLTNGGVIKNHNFITPFKATTYSKKFKRDFTYKDLGLIFEDEYILNPFNLGGKRLIENYNV
ncbi:MAG TPA: hypothetical protein GX695_01325, partial [Acholeplasmataceae bacterium]|nr:hypothetical protein [Acholeplasmataceae bacterium]